VLVLASAGLAACNSATAPAANVQVTVVFEPASRGVNPPLPSGTQPPTVIADPYTLTGPCTRDECLLARASFPAGLVGVARVQGYYNTVSKTEITGEARTCDALTVVAGSKVLIERYLAHVDSGNTTNGKNSAGQLVLTLSLNALSPADREAITASMSLSPVRVLLMPLASQKGGEGACDSPVEVLRVDTLPPAGQTATFTSTEFGITLQYPATWQPGKNGDPRYSSDDGYFTVSSSANMAPTAQEACRLEAAPNRKDIQFGQKPTIENLQIDDQPACLIMPSGDQPATENGLALLIVQYPTSTAQPHRLLSLFADKAHIRDLGQSLRFIVTGH
jgi:hypothetical protein